MDGMYGAIIINPDQEEARPFHMISHEPSDWAKMREAEKKIQTLMISDWSQYDFKEFMRVEETANIDYTCMDAIIVNGAVSVTQGSLYSRKSKLTMTIGVAVLS